MYIGGTKCTWKEARRCWAGFLEQDLPRIDLGEIRIDLEKAPLIPANQGHSPEFVGHTSSEVRVPM